MNEEHLRNIITQDFALGHFAKALASTRRLLEEFPNHAFGWKAMAAILMEGGHLVEARPSLLKAIALDAADADNWVNLGNLERASGKPGEAIHCYRRAMMLRSDFSTAKVNLATVLSEIGQTHEAIELLRNELKTSPNLPAAHLTLGNIYKKSGALQEAEHCYHAALAIQKDYFEALLNLSSVFREQGQSENALHYCKAAITKRPQSAVAYSNLGNIFAAMRMPKAAIDAYQTAIKLEPSFLEAQVNLSNILRQTGDIETAIGLCRRVIDSGAEHPKARLNLCFCLFERRDFSALQTELANLLEKDRQNPSAIVLSGLLASEQGRWLEAIQRAGEALAISANDPYVHLGAGSIHAACGRVIEAEFHYREAIRLDPKSPEAQLNLANLLLTLGQHAAALDSVSIAIGLYPELAQGHATKALILRDLRLLREAGEAAFVALSLRPDVPQIQSTMGLVKLDLGSVVEASEHFFRALESDPHSWIARLNYANALREMGRHHQSIALYREALALSEMPESAELDLQSSATTLPSQLRAPQQPASNYLLAINYHSDRTDAEIHAIACSIASRFSKRSEQRGLDCARTLANDQASDGRLRIGFVSGDIREHPVGYFTEDLFQQLAEAGHLLFAYPTTPAEDDLTRRVQNHFVSWRTIFGVSDEQAAGLIANDRVDALIDLSGHTAANRLGLFSYRPAPVQLTWLGYCGTTGLSDMDYIIADEIAIPFSEEAWYSEKVVRINGSYACLGSLPVIPARERPPMLDRGYCTFGSFNNLAKLGSDVIRAWSKILSQDSSFRLFLKSKQFADYGARKLVTKAMLAEGVHENQLLFEAADTRQAYLKAYDHVDLVLDPFPYPGFTTSIEALWMGVPILTMKGKRFIQRNGEIILRQIDMDEWIAYSEADYVERAVNYAGNPATLCRLRGSLRERLAGSPLTDIRKFSKNLTELLNEVCSGTRSS